MSGPKVQTQIRLLLEEQSDQGLHCLLLDMHLLKAVNSMADPFSFNFRLFTAILLGVRIFRYFTVFLIHIIFQEKHGK